MHHRHHHSLYVYPPRLLSLDILQNVLKQSLSSTVHDYNRRHSHTTSHNLGLSSHTQSLSSHIYLYQLLPIIIRLSNHISKHSMSATPYNITRWINSDTIQHTCLIVFFLHLKSHIHLTIIFFLSTDAEYLLLLLATFHCHKSDHF